MPFFYIPTVCVFCLSGPQYRVQATKREGGQRGAERDIRREVAEPPRCFAQGHLP